MSRSSALFISVLALAAVVLVAGCDSQTNAEDDPSYLYVLSASSGSFESGTLTLQGTPAAAYFSDRPERLTGHLGLPQFVSMWDEGEDSFASDPPNSYLAVADVSGDSEIILVLEGVELDGDTILFDVESLEGAPPTSFGPATLFIDADIVNPQITD